MQKTTHLTVPPFLPEVSVFNQAFSANQTNASQILNTLLGSAPVPPAPPPLAELGYPVGVPPVTGVPLVPPVPPVPPVPSESGGVPPVPPVPPVPGMATVAPLPVVPNPPGCTTDLSSLIYLVSGQTEMR